MMDMQMEFDTTEFERAMVELANESERGDAEIVTMNARTLTKALVYNTPRDTGATRAGFWPAWEALEMSGTPGTRKGMVPFKKRDGSTYVPDGLVRDNRRSRGEPSFELVVKTHRLTKDGKKIYYPYVLNAKQDFWGKGHRKAAFKFGKLYDRLLRKHGKL